MPDDTHMDFRERVAALEQMLAERTAERDEALQRESATHLTHPPPRWGRACPGLDPGAGVGVMPRTDRW